MAADFVAEGDRWWAHIEFLADDKLQGRETGSDGYREAVRYVAGKMETFGLKPAGTSGYLQPVKLETRQLVEEESSIAIVREGGEELLDRLDATQSTRADLAPTAEAAMVFVGYGLRVPEAKYDDLAGVDLRGKIAVYVNSTGSPGRARTSEVARRYGAGTLGSFKGGGRHRHRCYRESAASRGNRWWTRCGCRHATRGRWAGCSCCRGRTRTGRRARAAKGFPPGRPRVAGIGRPEGVESPSRAAAAISFSREAATPWMRS